MSKDPKKKSAGVKLVSKVKVSESLTIEVIKSRSPEERKRLKEEEEKEGEEESDEEVDFEGAGFSVE